MKNYSKKEKAKKLPITGRISESVDLPIDILGGYPYIQLGAGRELIIEGKCRILEYSNESLCALCRKIKIRITGRGLDIRAMDDSALIVCGVITSLMFEE